jgi:hypothetical protein
MLLLSIGRTCNSIVLLMTHLQPASTRHSLDCQRILVENHPRATSQGPVASIFSSIVETRYTDGLGNEVQPTLQ